MDSGSHYVFVVGQQLGAEGKNIPSSEVFERLIGTRHWFLSQHTPFRNAYSAGDSALFYLAGPGHRHFAAVATMAASPSPIAQPEKELLSKLGLYGYDLRLPLKHIDCFPKRVAMAVLADRLEFIKDKRNYGLNLRQGAVRVSEKDFGFVLSQYA